jgi:pyruvate,water dikinase
MSGDRLLAQLEKWKTGHGSEGKFGSSSSKGEFGSAGSEREFASRFLEFLEKEMDISYENISLKSAPEVTLRVIIALSDAPGGGNSLLMEESGNTEESRNTEETALTQKYYRKAKEQGNLEGAERWLKIGKISWKLRDDDNLLVGKIENQLLGFIAEALKRVMKENRIEKIPLKYEISQWEMIYYGMLENRKIEFPKQEILDMDGEKDQGKARQLVGQPSSSGVLTGVARVIKSIDDFKDVVKGDVLVFDAVEPQMTFIISLAGAIVERRGGMLVHSSIIAREMRIPAVNGVPKATEWIKTGDWVTVNGDLGIVVIGKPEFEVELGATRP